MLGGLDAEPLGLDLRGVFVGGEGTLGIATRIAVTITRSRPAVRTMLLSFDRMSDAANTVSARDRGRRSCPAAMEVMDQRITRAVEHYVHAGFPTDAAAVLLAEVDGLEAGVGDRRRRHRRDRAAERRDRGPSRRVPTPSANCSGRAARRPSVRSPRSRPTTTSTTPSCHGRELAEVLEQIYEIADRHDLIVMNVFHAGDGNLHPLLLFDGREPGVLERVHAAGAEIITASLDAGGVLSGEHGIGVEKQAYMSRHVFRRRSRPSGTPAPGVRSRRAGRIRARCSRSGTAARTSRRSEVCRRVCGDDGDTRRSRPRPPGVRRRGRRR